VKAARQSGKLGYSQTNQDSMHNFKGMRFPAEIIMICIRWYAAYPLSYRHVEEMMEERGAFLGHATINRWAVRFLSMVEKASRHHKRPVGRSWRMDENYIAELFSSHWLRRGFATWATGNG